MFDYKQETHSRAWFKLNKAVFLLVIEMCIQGFMNTSVPCQEVFLCSSLPFSLSQSFPPPTLDLHFSISIVPTVEYNSPHFVWVDICFKDQSDVLCDHLDSVPPPGLVQHLLDAQPWTNHL